jgi:NADH dehydrogenase
MTPRTVTIFGGSGFIGRYLVRALVPTRASILVAARRPALGEFTPGELGQVVPIAADVTNDESVARAVDRAEVVINLVGILYERGGRSFQRMHVEAARRIAAASARAGAKRLIHVSALGANPRSPSEYARTKAEGERVVREAFPGATVVQPSIVFGPEDDFFNRFAVMARLAPVLPLVGGGHTRFQPVYAGDVATAIAAMIARDGTAGQTFELGGPHVYSFRELMEIVLRETARRRLLLPVPFALARIGAAAIELPFKLVPPIAHWFMSSPPLTRDQVSLLHSDSVVSWDALGFDALGIAPTACEVILPTYLGRYRRATGERRVASDVRRQRSGT